MVPVTKCAFHTGNTISHFCRYGECLLPLCRDCIPIHRKEHSNLKEPIQLVTVDEQTYGLHHSISLQSSRLDDIHRELVAKLNVSNHLHTQLRKNIIHERDTLLRAISGHFDSLCQEIDLNFQRREMWMQEFTRLYQGIKQQLGIIQASLQGEKHLRTIIMWNRLRPQDSVAQIAKQTAREFQQPSSAPVDSQAILNQLAQQHRMTVLDLQGDMGLSAFAKLLRVLRFGEQQHHSPRTSGIFVTKDRRQPQKLTLTKSNDRL